MSINELVIWGIADVQKAIEKITQIDAKLADELAKEKGMTELY